MKKTVMEPVEHVYCDLRDKPARSIRERLTACGKLAVEIKRRAEEICTLSDDKRVLTEENARLREAAQEVLEAHERQKDSLVELAALRADLAEAMEILRLYTEGNTFIEDGCSAKVYVMGDWQNRALTLLRKASKPFRDIADGAEREDSVLCAMNTEAIGVLRGIIMNATDFYVGDAMTISLLRAIRDASAFLQKASKP